MGFGLSFSKKKEKTKSTGTIDKTELVNQRETGGTTSTQTGTQNTQSNQATSSTGSSTTNQTSQQLGQTTNQSTTTGVQRSFSDGLTGDIESTIAELLGGIRETSSAVGAGVNGLHNFDADSFVNGIVSSASARSETALDESVNAIQSRIGSSVNNNSMAALLQQRAVNDSTANLAGIRAQATGAAQDILNRNLATTSGSLNQTNDIGVALVNALKGGNVSTEQSTAAKELQDILNQTTGQTNTSEQQNQQTNSAQQTTQVLAELIDKLVSGSTNTKGTETTDTTVKKGGGGFSLGF